MSTQVTLPYDLFEEILQYDICTFMTCIVLLDTGTRDRLAKTYLKKYDKEGTFETLSEYYYNEHVVYTQQGAVPVFPNVKRLVCRNSRIESIPSLVNLQELYCDTNLLNTLESLVYSQFISVLGCTANKLASLPRLDSLVILHCADNLLENLPEFPNLEMLDCSNNKLKSIPNLLKLRDLHCSNNELDSIGHLPNIERLEYIWDSSQRVATGRPKVDTPSFRQRFIRQGMRINWRLGTDMGLRMDRG